MRLKFAVAPTAAALLAVLCRMGAAAQSPLAPECNFRVDNNTKSAMTGTTAQRVYDPSKVDWVGFIKAVDELGKMEPRICSFYIRTFFHDAGSPAVFKGGKPSGADASILLVLKELVQPSSIPHAQLARYVTESLVLHFGASWSDALSVAAARCTQTLGPPDQLDIPAFCASQGLPLRVGKLDRTSDKNTAGQVGLNTMLPASEQTAPQWLEYWETVLNGLVDDPKWKLSVAEAAALMGSHTLLQLYGCQRDGAPDARGTCKGKLRNQSWKNDYFKDMLSGDIAVVPNDAITHKNATCFGGTDCGHRPPDMNGCAFNLAAFAAKSDLLSAEAQSIGGDPQPPNEHVVAWRPDPATRAPCCGVTCGECTKRDPRPFCTKFNRAEGSARWTNTVNDAYLGIAAQKGLGGSGADEQTRQLGLAYKRFAADERAWWKAYATAHCKLSNLGATFSVHAGDFAQIYGAQASSVHKLVADIKDTPCRKSA